MSNVLSLAIKPGVEPGLPALEAPEDEEEEHDEAWWRTGLIAPARAVVRWDHVDEDRLSRGLAEAGRKVTWSELFLDLVIVTDIELLAESFQSGALSLIELAVLYRMIYETWISTTAYASRFFTDDVLDKYSSGGLMFLLLCAGLRLGPEFEFPDSGRQAARACGAYYVGIATVMCRVVVSLPEMRRYVVRHAVAPALLQGAALFLAAETCASKKRALPVVLLAACAFVEPLWHALFFWADYLPKKQRAPLHIAHFSERRGCLRLILFGLVVTGCCVPPSSLDLRALGLLLLAFVVLLNLKVLAFDIDPVPPRRHVVRSGTPLGVFCYLEAAFFFDISLAVLGSCLRIVLAQILHSSAGFNHVWVHAHHAHILSCLCVALGVASTAVERLQHDQSHLLGSRNRRFSDGRLWTHLLRTTCCASLCGRDAGEASSSSAPSDTRYSAVREAVETARHYDDDDDARPRRAASLQELFFAVQIAASVATILACLALAVYCASIDADYEFVFALSVLALFTSILVLVHLPSVYLIQRASAHSDTAH